MTPDDDEWQDLPPSKSSRKRDALALQKLGEELVQLRAAELDTLPLPENLRDAIDEARRLTSRGALARQRQYIGKLMRDIDLAPLREAMAHLTEERSARARLRK
jgi:ribosome-associated protein